MLLSLAFALYSSVPIDTNFDFSLLLFLPDLLNPALTSFFSLHIFFTYFLDSTSRILLTSSSHILYTRAGRVFFDFSFISKYHSTSTNKMGPSPMKKRTGVIAGIGDTARGKDAAVSYTDDNGEVRHNPLPT